MLAERLDVQIEQTKILNNINYNSDNVIINIPRHIQNPDIFND